MTTNATAKLDTVFSCEDLLDRMRTPGQKYARWRRRTNNLKLFLRRIKIYTRRQRRQWAANQDEKRLEAMLARLEKMEKADALPQKVRDFVVRDN